jgi:hypothetical protein
VLIFNAKAPGPPLPAPQLKAFERTTRAPCGTPTVECGEAMQLDHSVVTAMEATTGFVPEVTFVTLVGLALRIASGVAGIVQPGLLAIGSILAPTPGPVIV